MGAPITWRSVVGPSLAEASRPMEAAGRSLNLGFENIRDILKEAQATDTANTKQMVTNRTNEALNTIYGLENPEAFAAAQKQGLFQKLMDQGAMIDQTAVRTALDGRPSILQDRAIKQGQFTDTMTERDQRPLVQSILTDAYSKDPKRMAAAQQTLLSNPQLMKSAEMQKTITDMMRQNVIEGREDTRWKWDEKGQEWKVAEEEHKAKLRPIQVQKAGLDVQNAQSTLRLTKAQISKAEADAADAKELRALETVIANAAAGNSAEKATVGAAQGKLASTLKLPVNESGYADFSNYTKEQLAAFDAAAKQSGVPLSVAMLTGDTQKANNLYQTLLNGGKFSPRLLRANENAIRGAFNSSFSSTAPVGNDAASLARSSAENTVGFDNMDSNNWYAPNSVDARKAYEEVATKLPDILKNMPNGVWFGDNQKDLPHLQKVIGEIAAEGITLKDGKTKVVPSVNDVLRVVRATEGSFRDKGRGESVKEALEEWLNSEGGLSAVRQGQESLAYRNKKRVEELTREALFPKPQQKK